jgi:hypothetical protein
MPRNQLKSLPCAFIRRGLAHVHPAAGNAGRSLAVPPSAAPGPAVAEPAPVRAPSEAGSGAT